jgi:hypothetical protein
MLPNYQRTKKQKTRRTNCLNQTNKTSRKNVRMDCANDGDDCDGEDDHDQVNPTDYGVLETESEGEKKMVVDDVQNRPHRDDGCHRCCCFHCPGDAGEAPDKDDRNDHHGACDDPPDGKEHHPDDQDDDDDYDYRASHYGGTDLLLPLSAFPLRVEPKTPVPQQLGLSNVHGDAVLLPLLRYH